MKFIYCFFICLIFSCSSNKITLQPYQLQGIDGFFTIYNSGVKDGEQGIQIQVNILKNLEQIELKQIYFKNKLVDFKKQSNQNYTAYIKVKDANIISQPTSENTSINIDDVELIKFKEIGIQLSENESIIKVLTNKKNKYYKLLLSEKLNMNQPM